MPQNLVSQPIEFVQGLATRTLGERYAIQRPIGSGASSFVFLARDLKLGRDVALKILRDPGDENDVRRFLAEIRVTARLQHPHIQVLLDSGESDGVAYYAMPYIEGESLRHRLERDGRIEAHEAYRLAREIAEALGHAHSLGLAHRDVKPENILLSQGHAILTDFGIVAAFTARGQLMLTASGYAIGTPEYMSPEQFSAKVVDGRSDVFSLGAVFYEMLTGHSPARGKTTIEIITNRLRTPPPLPSATNQALPADADALVAKAMATDPQDRFASGTEFAAALSPDGSVPVPTRSGALKQLLAWLKR